MAFAAYNVAALSLQPGSRLGPYEVLAPIGAGGMGEVYRARDERLKRDVAIKVLPASFSQDAERLRRFEREAQAAGALNHPNITAVFDIGMHDGAPYVVSELLEGETLLAALASGKLPQRKAVDYALQIAHGLAAAHDKGIIHRDLKPENLFVLKDGRIKILDFGLAKLKQNEAGPEVTSLPTKTGTVPGLVLGTLGYMSPEQVKGEPADARSDIFSFGAILHEMLSGNRAFHGNSAAETMSAILREEPPDLSIVNKGISPGLERIVRHCIEKKPGQRFHSAHDVAFALEALSGLSTSAVPTTPFPLGARKRRLLPAAVALALAVTAAVAYVAGRRVETASRRGSASFQQLTFRQQAIFNARFAPDGRTIVYSAAPQGNTPEIFTVRSDFQEAKSLGLRGVHLLSVSSRGELALLTGARYISHNLFQGTLARMPLEGGAPRDVLENVREADWSPDGSSLAVIREVGGKDRLECPAGKVLFETGGYLSDLRFAPRGDWIAFFEHPVRWDDRGGLAVVDLQGKKTLLADGFWGEEGIAWSSGGQEILFSAGDAYSNFAVLAVTLAGRRRTVLESAGGLTIHDVRGDGMWLTTRDDFLQALPVLLPGQTAERDLSWLDLSDHPLLSSDGKTILFSEQSGSVGANYAVCLRRTDGSPVVRLGDGTPTDLSPDGKSALAIVPTSPQELVLYPIGAGETRRLDRGGIESYESAHFFPDGRSVLFCGHEKGKASRCYVQEIGGKPRAVTPEGTTRGILSPDARQILVQGNGGLVLYPAGGGEGRPVPGTGRDDVAICWSREGGSLLISHGNGVPLRIERITLPSGRRELVRTLGPTDLSGVTAVAVPVFGEDEKTYAYVFARTLSHLFLVKEAR
jgi:eukaryotic-like serine/threonine-protein kinase